MKVEIKLPAMGESISEASIAAFLVHQGEAVQEGDEIVEIETEKVNQPLFAPASGELSWAVEEGATLAIGATIGYIDTEKAGAIKEKEEPSQPKEPPAKKEEPITAPEPKSEGAGIRQDAERFIEGLQEKKQQSEKKEVERAESREPMSRIRKTIARRLVEALHDAAMLTTFNEVDMSAVIGLRKRHKEAFLEKHGVKLGFMSFFVKAVVEAMRHFPIFNAYIDGDEIVQRGTMDIGIAVGTERGLVVPVLRSPDSLSFGDIEQEIAAYAKRARSGQLRVDDLEGGSFTITNGGVYGSLLSTPLLNPPQVGILGMHAILNRPIARGEEMVIRPMMYLALSYDHRLVDGKEAVGFLLMIKELLEDPSCMMLL